MLADAAHAKAAGIISAKKIGLIIEAVSNSNTDILGCLSDYLGLLESAEQPDHLMIGLVKYYIFQSREQCLTHTT